MHAGPILFLLSKYGEFPQVSLAIASVQELVEFEFLMKKFWQMNVAEETNEKLPNITISIEDDLAVLQSSKSN